MTDPSQLTEIEPDHVFDGGGMDCGSGLILLIRQNMLQVPVGGIMEMISLEPSVADELPPWCRMVGHEYLGTMTGDSSTGWRHFLRRGGDSKKEITELESDKQKARDYEWRLRVRATGNLESKAYCRNFSFQIGQPASFEEKDRHPSAVEYLLAALAGDIASGLASNCARQGLEMDDVEITVKGKLHNILSHLGLEDGDPSFRLIELICFASTLVDESLVRPVWEETLARSPLYRTLQKSTEVTARLAIV